MKAKLLILVFFLALAFCKEISLEDAFADALADAFVESSVPAFKQNRKVYQNVLRLGSKDSDSVWNIQLALSRKGYQIVPNGNFDEKTKNAVAAFQRAQGWRGNDADGIPGKGTVTSLGLVWVPANQQPSTPPKRKSKGGSTHSKGKGPAPGARVSTPFGKKGSLWKAGFHTGEDYAVPSGTPIYAATTGRVVEAAYPVSWGSAYGRAAIVETEGRRYLYAHLNGLNVRQGQHVKAGERIGTSGATGHVTGPHLHFEMRLRPYRYAVDARKPIF